MKCYNEIVLCFYSFIHTCISLYHYFIRNVQNIPISKDELLNGLLYALSAHRMKLDVKVLDIWYAYSDFDSVSRIRRVNPT